MLIHQGYTIISTIDVQEAGQSERLQQRYWNDVVLAKHSVLQWLAFAAFPYLHCVIVWESSGSFLEFGAPNPAAKDFKSSNVSLNGRTVR
jgi:hypothetical protein